MKSLALAAAFAAVSSSIVYADGHLQEYTLDPTHSAIKFSWGHGEFSTTFGMFFEVSGTMMLDEANPENTTISASMPLGAMMVDPTLKGHLASDRFFGGFDGKMVEFTSTSVEVTGENTAIVTGDLTIAGTTNEVQLDATLNSLAPGMSGATVAGFDATTTIMRSDFGVDWFTPFISDELAVEISIEASPSS